MTPARWKRRRAEYDPNWPSRRGLLFGSDRSRPWCSPAGLAVDHPLVGRGIPVRPGDRVFFAPGEEHWHGATATRLMVHIAIVEAGDDGSTASWGEHVTDEEYAAAPLVSRAG